MQPGPEPAIDPGARRPSILEEAQALVYGARGEAYGHPRADYARVVSIFKAITENDLTAAEGVIFMVCVKLSREMNQHSRDHLVDAAGYLQCLARIIGEDD